MDFFNTHVKQRNGFRHVACRLFGASRMKVGRRREEGSMMLTAMVLLGVFAIGAASLLTLAQQESAASSRAYARKSALAAAEAGMEEALAHINRNQSALGDDGWYWDETSSTYQKSHTLIDGISGFEVQISKTFPQNLRSEGWATVFTGGERVYRTIEVRTRLMYVSGVEAKESITCSGSAIMNSYDSSDTPDATYDPLLAGANCLLAVQSSNAGLINVDKMTVHGWLETFPGGQVTDIPISSGKVGSSDWINGAANGQTGTDRIEAGAFSDTYSTTFTNVVIPEELSGRAFDSISDSQVNTGNNPALYEFGTGDYKFDKFAFPGNKEFRVTGQVRMLVTDKFELKGSIKFEIDPASPSDPSNKPSLELYLTCDLSEVGNAFIKSPTTSALLIYIDGEHTIDSNGNTKLHARIYAPDSTVNLNGEFFGRIKCKKAFISKDFHADVEGTPPILMITSWSEL